MEEISFKERVRKAAIDGAKLYKENFIDCEYLICSKAFHEKQYFIAGRKKILHPSIKYKELIERFAEIELDLKVIALKDTTEIADKLNIEIAIQELKGLLDKK